MITVKQLKEMLDKYDDNDIVIIDKGGCTGGSPLDAISIQVYVPDSTWHGDFYEKELTPELESQGYCEDDIYQGDNGIDCIVLWTVN